VAVEPLRLAVIMVIPKATPFTWNVALVWFAGTMTVGGRVTTFAGLAESVTVVAATCADESVTVRVPLDPMVT
jgi:hypothetical protein